MASKRRSPFKGKPRKRQSRTYRSGLEVAVAAALAAAGVTHEFETWKVPYTVPSSEHKYTPDFTLDNGIIIETKGIFDVPDRKKHVLIREQHPNLDIRFVFSNAFAKLRKGSPTTYAAWCENNGFLWAHKTVPKEWLTEPKEVARKEAVEALRV